MTTVTSSTSSTTPTTSSSTSTTSTTGSSSSSGPNQSIINALGAGSGVDTVSLVNSLVAAQFDPKAQALSKQSDTATAQLSEVSKVKSAINDFASALNQLVTGGTLAAQPTVSNTGVLSATALPGAKLDGLSASVTVNRLATAQVASTASLGKRTDPVGTGTLTITLGTATTDGNGALTSFAAGSAQPVQVTIDSSNNSLDGIAAAINAAKAGVTATVITDVDGSAKLSLKGATGAANAFTVTSNDSSLGALTVDVGQTATKLGAVAGNAQLSLDGVTVERATNSVSDLITGLRLDLASAQPGVPVTIGSSVPTASLSTAVSNVVDTYNQLIGELNTDLNAAGGTLFNDSGVANLRRQLQNLTLTPLTTSTGPGAPTTLADLGVGTQRDGTLKLDTDRLSSQLANNPSAVEAIFASGTKATGDGLNAALAAINTAANSTVYGLGASIQKYTSAQSDISDQQSKLSDQRDSYKTQLTQQYAASDAKVAAYKSTLAFLKNQIDAWNAKN